MPKAKKKILKPNKPNLIAIQNPLFSGFFIIQNFICKIFVFKNKTHRQELKISRLFVNLSVHFFYKNSPQ
jgi:hypothetical protein